MLPIYLGADHAGFVLKEFLKQRLEESGRVVEDIGCFSTQSVDYPNYAKEVAEAIQEKKAEYGILICGSGEGMAMAANKFKGIRAGLAWNTEVSALIRQHNKAQIICLGARFTAPDYAWKMVQTFLDAKFEEGNHTRRIDLMDSIG